MAYQTVLNADIIIKGKTTSQWTSLNPVLQKYELGAEFTTTAGLVKLKIGDGITPWNTLQYPASGGGGTGAIATDTLWDNPGDLAIGGGNNVGVKLAKGTALQYLRVNSGGTGLEYATLAITSADITNGTIMDTDINSSAAISRSKLNFGSGLVDADIAAAAAIAISKLGATGTRDGSHFLAGDGTWKTVTATATAATTTSGSTVGQGDVESDLDWLYANTAGSAAMVAADAALQLQLDKRIQLIDTLLLDDFRWHTDATLSGSIGEMGWSRTAGTSAVGSTFGLSNGSSPGSVRLSTGTTANTNVALHNLAKFSIGSSLFWEVNINILPIVVNTNVQIRMGLTQDATTETPSNAIYLEKLFTDSTTWFIVTYIGGTQVRTASAQALPGNTIPVRMRMWRSSSTQVSVQISTNSGAFGTAEVVTFNPTATFMTPFASIKNSTTTTRNLEVDFFSLAVKNLARNV